MNHAAISNIIRARVATQIATGLAIPVAYDNVQFVPPNSGSYIQASVIFGQSQQVSLGGPGQKRFRHIGLLTINIFAPVNTGDGAMLGTAGSVEALFRAVTVSGVVFQVPNVLRVGQDGKYYQIAVQCPFYADDIG